MSVITFLAFEHICFSAGTKFYCYYLLDFDGWEVMQLSQTCSGIYE